MLKVVLWGLLGDPLGEKGNTKDAKIESVSEMRNDLALGKGHIRRTGRCQALLGVGNLMREMRSLNNYASWWGIWSWRQEADVREETEITKKGGLLAE